MTIVETSLKALKQEIAWVTALAQSGEISQDMADGALAALAWVSEMADTLPPSESLKVLKND